MSPEDRILPLEGVENFRDYGGYAVPGGRRVVRGRLWRSAHHGGATDADLERVEEELRAEARPALLEGVMEALEAIRERLQDEAAEAAEAAEEEARTVAEAMAAADLECADDTDALARKVVVDTDNRSGVLSCEWELPTIMHEHECSEAVALRAMNLYRAALLRAAEEHLESLDTAEVA